MVDQAYSLRELMKEKRGTVTPGRTLLAAVASGKGGVGKSMLTLNLAIALHQRGRRVLIIDADFGLANLDVMLGVTPTYNLSHILNHQCSVEDAIVHCRCGVMLISGGSGIDELIHLGESATDGLMREILRLQDEADIILFDLGAGVSDRVLQVATACARMILVTTPEPTAILDAYALLKLIQGTEDAPDLRLVVNRAGSLQEGRNTMDKLVQVANRFLGIELKPLGIVPFDSSVGEAIRAQKPLMEFQPKGNAALAIGKIADDFLGIRHHASSQGGLAAFLAKLTQRRLI